MTKTIVLIAALFAASTYPSFGQAVRPAAHQTGLIDTLIEQADTTDARSCATTFPTRRNCPGVQTSSAGRTPISGVFEAMGARVR